MIDLEKAQAILEDKNIKNVKISKATDMSAQLISAYRNGTRDIANAKYSAVHSLAKFYDVEMGIE